ncbi:MAG: RNA polymerase sigma factor [Rhodocyclaceae bacterium]|nr:RNA polymerase sigma factor [Rhodocyclaceae bacterium]
MTVTDPCSTAMRQHDRKLVAEVLAGTPDAFERLMRANNRRLFRTARSILRDDAEAEDAVQDGYIRAYHAIDRFRGESSLSSWLTRIVVNEALVRLRRRAAREAGRPDAGDIGEQTAPASETPEAIAMRRQLGRLIETSIDRLPDACRTVFVLRTVEGLDVAETAHCLAISEGAVKTALSRARRRLREAIGREIGAGIDDFFAFDGARCDRLVASVHRRLGLPLPPPG